MKKFFTFFLFLALIPNLYAALPVKGVKIEKIYSNSLEIGFSLPEYSLTKVKTEKGEFVKIEGDGFGYVPDYGKAQLPTVTFSVMLNSLNKPKVEIVSFEKKEITLDRKIYPVQKPWPKSRKIEDRPFTMDYAYYNSEIKASNLITLSNVYKIRDKAGVSLTIHPFQYNPKKNTLTVYTKVKLKIVGVGIDTTSDSKVFEKIYSSSFVNYFIPEASKTKEVSGERILIITPSQYTDELEPFVAHKEAIGYIVDVFTLDETGTTEDAIKGFIQSRYDNLTTRPDFVILVGDVDQIPAHRYTTTDYPYSDLVYSLLDGSDYFPDVALGRFSVSDGEELTNLINKIIYMENNIGNLPKEALFIAGYDSYYYEVPMGSHDYVIERFFLPDGFNCEKLYAYYGVSVSQISYSVNQGKNLIIYSGHGNPSGWIPNNIVFASSDVKNLSNTVYPAVFSFACLTGEFEYSECFAEAWIRAQAGASSFWGSSVYSYWDEDDVLEKGVFEGKFEYGLNRMAPMFNYGKMFLYNFYSGTGATERYFQQYNLMGDPSLYTDIFQPSSMAMFNIATETAPCGGTVYVELWDSDLTDSSITVKAVNLVDGTEKDVTFAKVDNGKYAATFSVDDVCGGSGGIIEFSYYDSKYGSSGAKTVSKLIYVDCQSPYIVYNSASSISGDSALYTVRFNEPVSGTIEVMENSTKTKRVILLENTDKADISIDNLTAGAVYSANFVLTDIAGNSRNIDDVYLFTTPVFNVSFDNSCDEDKGDFTSYADAGLNNWVLKISPYAYSNNICWVGTETGTDWESEDNILDESLQFGPVYVDGEAYLIFHHRYALESGYDGGVIEASFDGQSFFDIGNLIVQNGYTGTISQGYGSPIEGRNAFTGIALNEDIETVVDLSSFAGRKIYIRFRIGCDTSTKVDDGGWYIDDVRVEWYKKEAFTSYLVNLHTFSVISAVTSKSNDLVLYLYDADGNEIGSITKTLGENSAVHETVETLFQGFDLSNPPFTLKCDSSAKAGLFQMEDITDSTGNMKTWTEACYLDNALGVLVPHIASNFEYWDTFVQVMTPKSGADNFYLAYSPWYQLIPFSGGNVFSLSSREFNVGEDIFNNTLPEFDFGDAFVKAEQAGNFVSVCATESFRFKGHDNIAKLTLEQDFSKTLYVAHVDNSDYWWTGIAVVNPSSTDFATVDFIAYDESGNIVKTNRVYLKAGERYAFVAEDEFPETAAWLKIDSDYPLVGYELFGTMNRMLLTGIDLISTPSVEVLLPVVDSVNDWFGITMVNPYDSSNNVVIEGYLGGVKVFEKSMTLNSYQKWEGLLTDLYDGKVDMVKVTSDKGIVSFCLEGDSDMTKVGGVKGFSPF